MPLLSTFIAEPALSNLKSERRAFIIVPVCFLELAFYSLARSHCFEFNKNVLFFINYATKQSK